jgi:hypothetical protein
MYNDPAATYEVEIRRTFGGPRWKLGDQLQGEEAVTAASMQVTLYISGRTPVECGNNASIWKKRLRAAARYYVGARYVTVLGVTQVPESQPGRAALNRTLVFTFELLDDLWRLSDDDVRPTRYPVEETPGQFPFGMLTIASDGTYSLLGGVSGFLSTLSLPNTGITLTPLELTYDQANEF